MSTATRLGLFAGGVALTFGASFLVGATVGGDVGADEPPTSQMSEEEGMGHGDA